ncbi:phosphatidylinositol 4-phosphate 3-kinase C2 domain-containing subunit alpha [Coccinella septempunctata]|uniref:phosphatidylinositol 4-phosphate 3-kinase C2 domain-containing subunit alpha n=1 Tax=Coccinella septempunctata TaxID=41139 RepID=UPI001D08C36D|nr:phosphatidylinositol 4-phosphate 3-kinase C2 domain-containing subunit alpha [Coccinella septempunctata]
MAQQIDWDKKYQEDLERAQALSLESLALEQFRQNKISQERNKIISRPPKNVPVNRAASVSETDCDRRQSKSRPRPGTSVSNQNNSLLAPPPSSQRKSSGSSSSDMPDLISFSSPPSKSSNLLDICSLQQYNHNLSTPVSISQTTYCPVINSNTNVNTISPLNFSQHSPFYQPYQGQLVQHQKSTSHYTNTIGQSPYGSGTNNIFLQSDKAVSNSNMLHNVLNVSPFSQQNRFQQNILPTNLGISPGSPFQAPSPTSQISLHKNLATDVTEAVNLIPPTLPPKNQRRTPPPIALPSSLSSNVKAQRRKNIENLIDLASLNLDNNSVRVSILQEFDPILSSNDYSNTFRTISPECPDDSTSVCGSVYDEYDPYDFIYTGSGNNSLCDPMYAAVNKAESLYSSPVRTSQAHIQTVDKGRTAKIAEVKSSLVENIAQVDPIAKDADSDLLAFFKMVQNVRNKYRYNDPDTNMGFVISPMVNYQYREGTSIKLCIHPDFDGADFDKPFIFTCDVTSSIEHITLQATCDLEAPSEMNYTLKVWGYNEYFAPTTLLSDYEYVHNCIKLEEDVLLVLLPDSKVDKSFARTPIDDQRDKHIAFEDVVPTDPTLHITYDNMRIVLEFLESEIKKLEEQAELIVSLNSPKLSDLQPNKVIQSVKYVINLMSSLCTIDIMEAVDCLTQTCNSFSIRPNSNIFSEIVECCNKVKVAVLSLIEMYCSAFRVDFKLKNSLLPKEPIANVNEISFPLTMRLCAIYRPNAEWKHDFYLAAAQIYHGTKPIKRCILSLPCVKTEDHSWPARIVLDQWITFDEVPISSLSRESRLVVVIYGRTEEQSENNDPSQPRFKQEEIGWASVQLFDYDGFMVQGSMLLSIWPKESNFIYGPAPPAGSNCDPDHSIIGIDVNSPVAIRYPTLDDSEYSVVKGDFSSLDQQTQEQLLDINEMDMLEKVPPDIREVLWEKRHYLYHLPHCLPKVLLAAHSWEYSCLPDLHGILHAWTPLSPIQSLQLLLPTFPDIEVRKCAVKWISTMGTDGLVDYLPQLVVALKFETYENSTLAEFLLDRSLRSPRFAHYLFWLLSHKLPGSVPQNNTLDMNEKDQINIKESRYHRRMKLVLRALLAICGEALRNCFLSQQILVKNLNDIAENVQKSKDSHRQANLQQALQSVDANLRDAETSLPLSLTLRVAGVHIHSCSYFSSNALPLKINFLAPDRSIVPAIYKVSDDLQQDMLTLQMVRIMDKMWLNHGLDLKMVSFICIPTGKKKGMIELVKNAETLRKIQVEHGLTGSFKDKPIAEWLAKYNPSELEYGRAVENFTASCAGYCVVTYILGICDRHNDNIMLKTSGHLFHIDFGKFLGDAQMFGNFKRDRAPFVLTSDMAYVINGGDRPSEKFHQFVDLCCQAFNIVRANGNLILYIFTLMMSSGMCGVTTESVNYLHKALLPRMSNPEAAAYFARLIESSLKSWFTQFNFFLHNLAQLKFTAEQNDGTLLSFVPKTYTMESDGRLKHVEVVSYRKRYDPDKYYVYILRVYREDDGQHMEIQRTYKEFCELHQKLCIYYPLAKLHR